MKGLSEQPYAKKLNCCLHHLFQLFVCQSSCSEMLSEGIFVLHVNLVCLMICWWAADLLTVDSWKQFFQDASIRRLLKLAASETSFTCRACVMLMWLLHSHGNPRSRLLMLLLEAFKYLRIANQQGRNHLYRLRASELCRLCLWAPRCFLTAAQPRLIWASLEQQRFEKHLKDGPHLPL